jgi:hypothetical protein
MKKLNFRTGKKQAGFIAGPILVGIALIIAVVAFMAFANRGTSTSTSSQQAKLNAAVILKQAGDLAEGYVRAIGDGETTSTLNFVGVTGVAAHGLFDPTKGYASQQTVPSKICSTGVPVVGDCVWGYSKTTTVTGVGTAAADSVVAVSGLDVGTCDAINYTLFNDVPGSSPASAITGAAMVGTALLNGVGGDMGLVTGAGRQDGCVQNGGAYTYYKVVAAN